MPWWRSISRHSMPWPRVHGGVTTGRSSLFTATCATNTRSTTVLSEHDVVDVVHAAAITSPAHESTLAMLDVNLRATQVLLDFAAEQPLRRLVFVSSAGVFRSAESVTPLDEAFPVTMEHPYAIFKVAAERLVAFARRERQVDATSVRLGFVYGPYERPTGSRTAMSSVYDAVALARRGEPIVAMAPEVGRDWIHAADVARGVRMLLDHEGPLAPLYHLGTGRNSTMRETMETIAALIPGTVLRWTDNASEANVVVAEENRRAPLGFARAQADFGFTPAFSLRGWRARLRRVSGKRQSGNQRKGMR